MPFVDQFKRRGKDLIENPGPVVNMLVDRLRNYNAGEVPVIADGELKMKSLNDHQMMERYVGSKTPPDESEKGMSEILKSLRSKK